jgi:hypothetical protein
MYRFKNLMVNVGEGMQQQADAAMRCLGTKWCRYPTPQVQCQFLHSCGRTFCIYPTQTCIFASCGYRSPIIEYECANNSRIDPTEFVTPYTDILTNPVVQAQQLAALKQELQQALAEIDVQEQAMSEAQAPQTLEEVQALETELEQALKEVEALKHKMAKGK